MQITLASQDNTVQDVFTEFILPRVIAQLSIRGSLHVTPRISLVGSLQAGQAVPELQLTVADIHILPASGAKSRPCLALGLMLGGARANSALSNFVELDDFAVIIPDAVVQSVVSFRWRVGDYPRERISDIPVDDPQYSYVDGTGTTVSTLIYTRLVQTDILDNAGGVRGELRVAGSYTYGAKTQNFLEDHLLLGGHCNLEIASVLRKDDLQPVPAQVRDTIATSIENQNVEYDWPFLLSSVAAPPPSKSRAMVYGYS